MLGIAPRNSLSVVASACNTWHPQLLTFGAGEWATCWAIRTHMARSEKNATETRRVSEAERREKPYIDRPSLTRRVTMRCCRCGIFFRTSHNTRSGNASDAATSRVWESAVSACCAAPVPRPPHPISPIRISSLPAAYPPRVAAMLAAIELPITAAEEDFKNVRRDAGVPYPLPLLLDSTMIHLTVMSNSNRTVTRENQAIIMAIGEVNRARCRSPSQNRASDFQILLQ